MFTPGFKLFFGLAVIGLIGAFVYGLSSSDVTGPDYFGVVDRTAIVGLISLGWKGGVGDGLGYWVLLAFSGTAAMIGITSVAFRDADVESVAELDTHSGMPHAQRPTAPSWWPFAFALGVGVVLMGLVLDTNMFWIAGLAILAVVGVEWALSAWADRSTGDASTNSALRSRVLAPFEIPLFAIVVGGAIALAISRILLRWPGLGAVASASIIAILIMVVALLAVFKDDMNPRVLGGIIGVFAVAIIALGIIAQATLPHHHGEGDEDHAVEAITTVIGEIA